MAKFLAVLKIVVAVLHVTHGCQMEGVGLWAVPVTADILDVFSGTVMSRSTTSIEGIQTVTYGEGTIGGPYLEVSHSNSQFVMSTRAEYEAYEEIEVSSSMSLTVTFSCTGGTTATLIFLISVIDTNNNAPQFIPSNNFEFVVAPPLPPGFLVTGCLSYISVRDIDLTTQRIDFTIEENPYFEIEYDSASSTVAKEFNAVLRTTTFLRSLTEPITLRISATDVDLTGDEPLTTSATVTILADAQFQLPEEPVFSQPYYVVNYSDDHQLVQLESIHLQQGFDEHVNFTLEGEYEDNFSLTITDNEVTIVVTNPLPNEVVATNQIYLILRANRENTSGGSATIIVQFPEESSLSFESSFYVGAIENNVLSLPALILIDGYENTTVTATVDGEYSSYFSASVVENVVTITMTSLTDDIIESNSFISLEVVASSPSSEAITIVSLELIKDDTLTPVFEKAIYSGTYDPETGLAIEQIVLTQGADDTVNIGIFGVHEEYFQITRIGANVIVSATSLPAEIFADQHVVLSIEAEKPRTVGANAALIIALPAAKELIFQETFYKGTVQDNVLTLGDIRLDVDYDETVNFTVTGEHSEYFNITNTEGVVSVSLGSTLPETVITQNTVILLTLTASGLNAVSTTATILIDILKEDDSTPIFSRNIYYGTYLGASNVEIESISLSQGYDDGVSFRLDGEHSKYFGITYSDNVVTISLDSAPPEDLIFNEKVLLFNVLADKALTVGANAAIVIGFPTELTEPADMRFAQNTYLGSLEGDVFSLGDITLDSGYIEGTSFHLSGEHYQHFQLSASNNVVQITYLNTLPIEDVTNNDFIVLDVEARRERAVSTWTSVVVHLVKNENLTTEVPVFSQAYYRGSYDIESGLQMNDVISLSNGFDDAVTFELEGDQSQWFALSHDNNVITLELNGTIPVSVVENNNQLLFTVIANNGASFGRAAILIELPKDCVTKSPQFVQQYYRGYIENEILSMAPIYLDNSSLTEFNYTLVGEFSDLFQVEYGQGIVELTLRDPVTDVNDADLIVMVLEIESGNTKAHTVLIVEIVKQSNEDGDYLAFDEVFYTGSYTEGNPLQFTTPVSLATGYDSSVEFALEGDSAQWFGLVHSDNSVIVTLASPIPSGVLANNHHLIFVITAQGNNTNAARATVVISLTDEYTEGLYLAFERVSYLGSIGNDQTNIPEIVLSEGYDQNVAFTLHGDLSSYFFLSSEGPTVTISLSDVIPEDDLPTNGIIVLEIQASAPPALTAYTTLIIGIVRDESSVAVDLAFAEPYYTGSFAEGNPLQFTTPVSLATGYDSTIEFDLEGDSAQWFGLVRNDNSVIVTLAGPIPSGVLANNHHLIFVITAQGNNTNTARATVVISLTDEYTEGLYLAFERVSYLGSIGNDQTNIPEIVLSEGYDQNVAFTLHGDLSSYFSLSSEGLTVTVSLSDPIPEINLPTNGIIVLEIQASAPPALTAYTTLIIEIVRDDSSLAVDLVFAQPYYTGSYTEGNPLQFTTPVSLTNGYDSSVEFALEGDSAQWFGLVRNDNSVIVTLAGPIPSGVLANNHHLIFVITAQGNNTNTARATVVISLTDEYTEGLYLAFERVSYLGSIGNDRTNIPEIVLSEGYAQNVAFTLHGDLSSYFSLSSEGPTVTISLSDALPEDDLPINGIIVLEIQASGPPALTAYTTLIIEIVRDDSSVAVDIVFAQPYYTGSYTEGNPMQFTTPVSLATGYDSSVEFTLEGDSAQWFGLVRNDNSVIVTLASPIPSGVLANNHHLIFVITAQGNNTNTARATVVISLTDEYTEGLYLAFERVSYLGSIENDQTNIPEIVLSEGYDQNVAFTLHGDLSSYFSLSSEGPTVTISLSDAIPEDDLPTNGIIVLEIQASAPSALTAYTTLIIEIVRDDSSLAVDLVFAQPYYTGSYTEGNPLQFTTPVSLTNGYDSSVEFALEGDSAQWFGLVRNDNSVIVTLASPIPSGVLANNHHLIFVITAQGNNTNAARATVVISLTDEYTEGLYLAFERVSYLGSIGNDQTNIPEIVLSEGYDQNVAFTLHGDLSSYFFLSSEGPTVTISLSDVIPEDDLPTNGIIVLEIQASAPPALTAYTTLIIGIVRDESSVAVDLAFAEPYYTGSFAEGNPLQFTTPVSLATGYDSTIEFDLEGDSAQWFGLVRNDNSVIVTLAGPIPSGVLANNHHLIFVITAQGNNTNTARATVVISLTDEYTEGLYLAFERVSYLGSIGNDQTNIPEIVLSEGYDQNVAFTLHGDLSSYFSLSSEGLTVTVSLSDPIPEINLPTNGIIVLEIQASAPPALTAYTTLIIEIVRDDSSLAVDLVFAQPYYTGSYTEGNPLQFTTPVSLTNGYDSSVEFALEGDSAQWFGLVRNDNSVIVTLAGPIPSGVLANNHHLIFVITAQGNNTNTARATVVISLTDEYTEGLYLAFERVSYLGSIGNDRTNIPEIVLSEGYAQNVAFTLHGDLSSYFSLSSEGPTVTISLSDALPEDDLPINGIIVLEIQASGPPALTAYTTLIIEIVRDDSSVAVDIVFAQPYYTGSYTEGNPMQFTTPVSLATGYDSSVEFTLEGDSAQWFGLVRNDNSVIVTLASPIPSGVIANNHHLIFVITAQGNNTNTARATVVISLTDEYTEGLYLAFERVSYLGSIENDQTNIPEIVLSEGYDQNVAFTLHGDLSSYFSLSSEGPTVTISLSDAIPEDDLPTNGIIVLEIQASAPPALIAYTTLIIEIVRDDSSLAVDLVFAQPYYTGSYTEGNPLQFTTPVSLTNGYDSSVEFALEGDSAQWFGLVRSENSVIVMLASPIPSGVLANNHNLIFVITAQGNNTNTARATVVISLTDEYTEGLYLAFERVSYQGSIRNDQTNIPEIVLSEGYDQNVAFTLHGGLSSYFSLSSEGPTVTISLSDAIPEDDLPINGIIVLEIQASAPPALTAYTTLIIEIIRNDSSVAVDIVFAQPYYTGSYTEGNSLQFTTPVSLATGYDSSVEFTLEGDSAQWFGLVRNDNSVIVTLAGPIPSGVLANNYHLIFVITAQGNNTNTARATVVISLTDEYTEGLYLAFERVSYLGSIGNDQTNIPEIVLSEGYDQNVAFTLHGGLSSYFSLSSEGPIVTVSLSNAIPEDDLPANGIIVLEIQASAAPALTAYATLVIEIIRGDQVESDVTFGKVLYKGILENNIVYHETITINGFSGTTIEVLGEFSSLFEAVLSNGEVTVRLTSTWLSDQTHVPLELRAGSAGAVLLLNVRTEGSGTAVVTFSSPSYAIRVEISQTGAIGQVQAIADNGEPVTYSLLLDNSHLEERLSINSVGEILLAAPVNSGFYSFGVEATTVFTQISGTAAVYLSVEAVTVCGDELVMAPLIILDRDEEEPHRDLINGTEYEGCRFIMTNRWPLDQNWVYADETGVHTTAIDREHESIAFMALSQVQVEVTLQCAGDTTRVKRSLNSDTLGPYDYGTNKWVLTDTILFNPRRTLLNLIVNDINDNAPIFDGKATEPIAVGCPNAELQAAVMPRSLAELHATDADIGENAALVYWSSDPELSVSPTTGFVHIREGSALEQDSRLTVYATDQNGQGLTGSLELIVKLLDDSNIAVVTVTDAFLDDETTVLSYLKDAVGYDVKVLRSAIVAPDTNQTRIKRDIASNSGVSLQLYIYGLVDREPVTASRLIEDISTSAVTTVTIASSVSLEDHLANQEICVISERDTGLLVATIVLSVLLFVIIVMIAVWYFLKWRRNKNYDQFSDENSLASRSDSVTDVPKPEVERPRLNIEELKRSERRLQEMLNAPVPSVTIERDSPKPAPIPPSIIDIPIPETNAPIVIQSFDKLKDADDDSTDDEFGEIKTPRRKSVVTFNENVEKIIRFEDNVDEDDSSSNPEIEIYKL